MVLVMSKFDKAFAWLFISALSVGTLVGICYTFIFSAHQDGIGALKMLGLTAIVAALLYWYCRDYLNENHHK